MFNKRNYVIAAVTISAGVLLFVLSQGVSGGKESNLKGPTFTVEQGPLTISFIESGTIQARQQEIIKNEVEGRTVILTLIEEGEEVKKGDLLVELDSSSLEDRKVDREISVQNTEASFINAKENLEVVKSQAQSDLALARQDLDFARQDLKKYKEGDYPSELRKAEADIQLAKEELTRAQDTNEWSEKLYKENYISLTEYQADKLAVKKRELDVELTQNSKELLEEYTHRRKIAELETAVEQAEMELERTERKASADVIQAQANLKAKEAEYQRQKDRLAKLIDQIQKTKIRAPMDGTVIYATSAQSGGWRGNTEPLEEGQEVREREELIYLRTGDSFKAETTIHESNIKKTRTGLPVVIKVDALSDKTFYGTLAKVAPLPDAQSMWMNPDLKVYSAQVNVEGGANILRTGMSCQAEILVTRYPDAVYVPLQAVTRVGNNPTVYVKNGNSFEPRKVRLGMDNNKMIHITEGLKGGQVVSLVPPLKNSEKESEDTEEGFAGNGEEKIESQVDEKLAELNSDGESSQADSEQSQVDGQKSGPEGQQIDPEKRQQMREKFEQLSDEEKAKLQQQMRKSGGKRGGSGQRRQQQ